MSIDILKAFPIDKLPYWMAFTVMCLILLTFGLIIVVPKIVENNIKNNKDFRNSRNLQVESYFRKISSNEIKTLFETWIELLMGKMTNDEDELTKKINYLIEKTTMYGSSKTVKLLAMYQQENYLTGGKVKTALAMAYISEIISSLKYDFSGYKVEPINIVKVKITDISSYEKEFNKNVKIIEKAVKREENKVLSIFNSLFLPAIIILLIVCLIIYFLSK